jgi:hypothetical protein
MRRRDLRPSLGWRLDRRQFASEFLEPISSVAPKAMSGPADKVPPVDRLTQPMTGDEECEQDAGLAQARDDGRILEVVGQQRARVADEGDDAAEKAASQVAAAHCALLRLPKAGNHPHADSLEDEEDAGKGQRIVALPDAMGVDEIVGGCQKARRKRCRHAAAMDLPRGEAEP